MVRKKGCDTILVFKGHKRKIGIIVYNPKKDCEYWYCPRVSIMEEIDEDDW